LCIDFNYSFSITLRRCAVQEWHAAMLKVTSSLDPQKAELHVSMVLCWQSKLSR